MSSERGAFWAKVKRDTPGRCWEWLGARSGFGHGNVAIKGRAVGAHRVSWEITNGPIPDGLCVLHHCDNPPCVNPAHLFLGTKLENAQDRTRKGRSGDHRGVLNGRATMTDHDAALIRFLASCGVDRKRLATLFNVSLSATEDLIYGRTWKHVPNLEAP